MAAMADAYEINVASHNFSGPLSAVISSHFAAVVPNFHIMELDIDEVPWKPKLLTRPYKVENGAFVPPSRPRLGHGGERRRAARASGQDVIGVVVKARGSITSVVPAKAGTHNHRRR